MFKKKVICIVSPFAYPVITNKNFNKCGGSEVQLNILAKELSAEKFEIHFIVNNEIVGDEKIGNINMHYIPFRYFGGKKKTFIKDTILLKKKINKINPDYIIVKTPKILLFSIGLITIFNNAKLIKIIAHNAESNDKGTWHESRIGTVEKIIYRIGLKFTHKIIFQTEEQRKNMNIESSKKGPVIKNILNNSVSLENVNKNIDGIWIGKCIERKNPFEFLKLCTKLKNYRFGMIISRGPNNTKYNNMYNEISLKAKSLDNLTFYGEVSYLDTFKYINKSKVLISTSFAEGFPNVFLQSWQFGNPVISLNINPDNIIEKYNLGFVANNSDDLANLTEKILNNSEEYNKKSLDSSNYINKYHNSNIIINKYLEIFQ